MAIKDEFNYTGDSDTVSRLLKKSDLQLWINEHESVAFLEIKKAQISFCVDGLSALSWLVRVDAFDSSLKKIRNKSWVAIKISHDFNALFDGGQSRAIKYVRLTRNFIGIPDDTLTKSKSSLSNAKHDDGDDADPLIFGKLNSAENDDHASTDDFDDDSYDDD